VSNSGPDRLEILPAVKGSGFEPEEAPARRVQSVPLTVNLSNGSPQVTEKAGRPALDFPHAIPILRARLPVTAELTAGEVAGLLRERCARCVHFRNHDWQETKKVWGNAPIASSRRQAYIAMVKQYASAVCEGTPGLRDLVEASFAMNLWGTCDALSEHRSDFVIVHPEATCPDGLFFYQDRDKAAKREANVVYDEIMRKAQGR